MTMPTGVRQAIVAIWIMIAVSAVVAALDRRMGEISDALFVACLLAYALLCIFPYKLSRGSNPTRYTYTIITAIGYLTMLGGMTDDMTRLDLVSSVVLLPVQVFVVWRLFSGEAAEWFANAKSPSQPKAPQERGTPS